MIVIQTSRIFVVPEVPEVPEVQDNHMKNIPIKAKIEPKKEQSKYTKKAVKYFIPEFYI